jgi:tetratricopeptide (TPR) repeat protein
VVTAAVEARLSMSLRLLRLLLDTAFVCSFALCAATAHAADSTFDEASAAFQNGDYLGALALFEAVRAAGAEGPSATYNIGVCRFKLGEFEAAEAEFAALGRRFPTMYALAEYNRGLALVELGRSDEARSAFATARAEGDPKVAALAAMRLGELGGAQRVAPRSAGRPWQGLFEVTAGDDDNVALVDEIALPAGQSADSSFTELLGFASRRPSRGIPVRLDFSGYLVRYPDASQFDQDSLRATATLERSHGAWRFGFGPYYGRSTLDGDGFQEELGAGMRLGRALGGAWRFTGSFAYTDVGALESRFAYLEGAKRQARAALVRRMGAQRLDLSLDFEDSDRAAANFSARRQRLTLAYRRDVAADWSIGAAMSYRASRYDRATGPDERLQELRLDARRALGNDWSVTAGYRRSSNDSDLASFSYDANRISLSIGKDF